jgi:cyanophycin synthetase
MKAEEIQVLRGPNRWSPNYYKLIVLRLSHPEKPSGELMVRLERTVPGIRIPLLQSENLPYIVGTIALELQKKAGDESDFLELHPTNEPGVTRVVFSYMNRDVGTHAALAAVTNTGKLMKGESYDIAEDLREMRYLREDGMGPTTAFILEEVKKRNIPYKSLGHGSLYVLGQGNKQKKIRTAVADTTSGLGIEIAGDKDETKTVLMEANIPVPHGLLVYSEDELLNKLPKMSFPLVIKPLDGNHGRGVTTNINSVDKALFGFRIAQKISRTVIVEEFIAGDDHRFLIINYKLVAVAKRTPARIIGDGTSTIRQLIDKENEHPDRGDTSEHVLAKIRIDAITNKILEEKNYTPETVLPPDELLYLKDTANISAGGTADDVTDDVHPENIFMAERIAKLFSLDICGVDILAKDVSQPIIHGTGAVIEVNAGPGIRMHTNPTNGIPRNVAKPIIDMLFPQNEARIPIVAVTGTNGKTTAVRLISHLLKTAGFTPGYTTSEGVYIDGHIIEEGDCSGSRSARTVLFDPEIDIAVLETARGGILRTGLGFDHCDISIVTNVTGDHLGLNDVHTLEEMAKVKRVVPMSTKKEGYAILNADDDHTYNMQAEIPCKTALFSMDQNSERIRLHVESGGIAAIIEDDSLVLYNGEWKSILGKVEDIPLSMKGRAQSMVMNILPSVIAAALLTNFNEEMIRKGLSTFIPSPEMTPGRFNMFNFGHFELMVDYAHNTAGFIELKKFLDKTTASRKVGIIAATGDRLAEDIIMQGQLSAEMYDDIIIRFDDDNRGRTKEEIVSLLTTGIRKKNLNVPVKIIETEKEALEYALQHAETGSLIVTRADHVLGTLQLVKTMLEERMAVNS